MRFLYCLLIGAAAFACADEPLVEVFLPPVPMGAMHTSILRARGVVEKIYSEIGIRVIWRSTASRPSGCSKTLLRRSIVVALEARGPAGVSNSALAYSNPYATVGPCVTLVMDHLQAEVRMNPLSSFSLLGHVLAHEMGHVLQGISRHSEAGVMKYRWSSKDTWHMEKDSLHFSPYDAELILGSLAASYNAGSNGKTASEGDR